MNFKGGAFSFLEIQVLEFQNILIYVLNMILILEFIEWFSSLFYLEEEKEFVIENIKNRIGNFQKVSRQDAEKWFVEKLGGTLI